MADILDEGLDELAVSAHSSFLPRIVVNIAIAGVFSLLLPWRLCLVWGCVTVGLEIQAWFSTRRQYLHQPVGWRTRLWHVSGLAAASIAWVTMGALLWASGSTEGAICGVLVWLSVIFFARTNAYQSPTGFVVGGAVPSALVLATILFAPHPAHMRLLPVGATMVIALSFAGEGVTRMLAARRRLNDAQAKVRESETRYRLLTESSTDLILRYDLSGAIEFASPSVAQLGYRPEDVVGLNIYDFGHPEEANATIEQREALLGGVEAPQGHRRQFRARRADGGYVWLEGNPSPIRDETGKVIGIMTAQRDVTARREMEEELRRKTLEAESAAVAKSEFLSNMSHEIRTPLTSIIGFSGLLQAVEELPSSGRTYADRIATASQTLLAVVNDILDFSKIEAGHIELDPHPFDPAKVVAETVELVLAQAQVKGLSLRAEALGELPAAVKADSGRLRQVLLNLLTNAVKFTDHGGVTVDVSYRAEGAGLLRIAVRDTGVGLNPDQAARLFQRFSQADNSISREHGGTGLGLAICKSLAELMGGEIGLDSGPGKGSTFWFTVAAPPSQLETTIAPDLDDDVMMRPARVLVVDDVAVNRELVKIMLSVHGHQLTEAANGAEAVRCALSTPFDLILMDLQMPGMDGVSATRAIRATSMVNARTPILALTANVMANYIEACRQAGMDDHIGKPIDAAELLTKVAHWTSGLEQALEANADDALTG